MCMISIGLKDWFAKILIASNFGANLPTYAKSMAQFMARQQ